MKVQVIVGSIRTGRVSSRIASWVVNEANNLPDTTAEIVELSDYELPLFAEAMPPRYNPDRELSAAVKKWVNKLAEADAFVIVTPEYNRSFPGALKNALDNLGYEFDKKPVSIVAHGSAGGAQAVSHLRGTLAGLGTITLPTATYVVGRAGELIDESGELVDEEIRSNPYGPQAALQATVSELKWYSDALSAARAKDK